MRNLKLLWSLIAVLVLATGVLSARLAQVTREPAVMPVTSGQTSALDKAAAKIGDREITDAALRDGLYKKYGRTLLNQMLDRQAVSMEADTLGLTVSDAEISQELTRMQQGYDSEAAFYRSMQEQLDMSPQELREDVRYKLLAEAIATRDIRVTDSEIDQYIAAHPDEFRTTVQYKIQQIVNDTLAQANKTAELARGGTDFGTLARERSLDTGTAGEGGDLGWIEEKDPFVPAPIRKAAGTMKPGEISRPIALDNGYAVIKLADRKELSPGTPEQIRVSVRKQLALQKAAPIKDLVQNLRDSMHTTILDPQLQS